MTTERRIAQLVEPHGFARHDEPGFLGWHRTHPDGPKQLLHVFFWSNAKYAAANGLPHAHIDAALAIDAPTLPHEPGYRRSEDVRLTITTKGLDGTPLPWATAAAQFADLILPIFLHPLNEGRELIEEEVRKEIARATGDDIEWA